MVRIRLARIGAKKKPAYRIAVADQRSARNTCIEFIGHYNPMVEPPVLNVDLARADHWISHGAQPSDTVKTLLAQARKATAAS